MKGDVYADNRRGGVAICNSEDDFYVCVFETREEFEAFIKKLNNVADETWPQTKSHFMDALYIHNRAADMG